MANRPAPATGLLRCPLWNEAGGWDADRGENTRIRREHFINSRYVSEMARKPGALRNGAPFKDWVLSAAIERVRRKLAGADDGNRQMVGILNR